MQDIWLEKYRPKTLNDVKGNKEIIEQFKTIVEDGVIPNMILSVKPTYVGTARVREDDQRALHRQADPRRALQQGHLGAERVGRKVEAPFDPEA